MLLNCSKIPTPQWPRAQLDTATTMYSQVQDLTFPTIDPLNTTTEIAELAQAYAQQIIAQHPQAVHVMGEPIFVYVLVRLLQGQGITCITSATRPKSNGRGYDFIQFRSYPTIDSTA